MSAAVASRALAAGLQSLGLAQVSGLKERLAAYLGLLCKWNAVYNLTAVRDPEAMVTQHVLDSLSVLPYLPDAGVLADLGAGAGLPGLPLAMARAALAVHLVESSQKKAAFLEQVVVELELPNVAVHCARAERLAVPRDLPPADAVIARALTDLSGFLALARPLVRPGGRLLAMKGRYPAEELHALPPGLSVRVEPLAVPGLTAARHVVIVEV